MSISISIIIAAYNDWMRLDSCLRSIAEQGHGPGFEVIIVDDGSNGLAPDNIRQWEQRLPLTIARQSHAGISAARNHGIQLSKGSLLLFVDADCRLQANCLAALETTVADSPQHNCFQLRLIGDSCTLVGRSEHLRLTSIQNQMLQPDGSIRYLNTAGFAIRRSSVPADGMLFDLAAVRGEDTLVLADLIERGKLPYFVPDAVVQHQIPLSVLRCIRKDIRSAFVEGGTYALIASRQIRIRMSNRERLQMLCSMWTDAKQPSIGRSAGLVLAVRQLLGRTSSLVYRLLHRRADFRAQHSSSITRSR
jgi:glycosyltransferase involved in cell wall biosynthesis